MSKKKAAPKKRTKRKTIAARSPKLEPQQPQRRTAYLAAWDNSLAGVSEEWADAMRRNHERGLHDERPGEGCPICAGEDDAA